MVKYLQALSTAVPEAALTTSRAADILSGMCPDERTARRLSKLLSRTGIERRHLAAMETQDRLDAPDGLYQYASMQPKGPGTDARSQAFNDAADRLVRRVLGLLKGDSLESLKSLLTVSCTHASSPGLDRMVFENSAVPHSADRWNLGFMGCSAALAGLRLLHRSVASGSSLLLACELSSLHFQYSNDVEQLAANLLFADGAAAAIVSGRESPVRIEHAASVALPRFADQMLWWAGDFGLRLRLSPELPTTLSDALPSALDSLFTEFGEKPSSIKQWLVHPGGPQILDVVESRLGLPPDGLSLSRDILRNYGNMSSPTILFILRAAIERGIQGRVAMLAFGPGLTVELVLADIGPAAAEVLRGPSVNLDTTPDRAP